ncbi:113R [Yaba monkey tumor virus]|uniref:113R n=1 Tax=Yaba monkey tumor virus (strain VR587) TaxID=928314 RepID=Q6TUQ6_YMTV5|nr:113R [Yaba monkey tumor virus]AAR07469.1 113R [Yaba monkey tumor virus]
MATFSDLKKLNELLRLYKCLDFSDKLTREKYNSLVEWANNTYWKIGLTKVINFETSITKYYSKDVDDKNFELKNGKYIFLPMCFGNTFIYSNGTMMELGSGNVQKINKNFKSVNDKLLMDNPDINFLKFVLFNGNWILEDVFSTHLPPTEFLKIASKYINVVPYIHIYVKKTTIFDENDYNSLEEIFLPIKNFYINSICYIKEGDQKRNVIDFYKLGYVNVKIIDMELIGNNLFVPKIISSSGKTILVRDVDQLITSKAKKGSFVSVRIKKTFYMLNEKISTDNESRAEVLCRIMKDMGNDVFVNGKYLSKVNNFSICNFSNELGLRDCKNVEDFTSAIMQSALIRTKFKTTSTFNIVKECLKYPSEEFITLVNNMNFVIENGRVKDFKLKNVNCLNNPTIETIYGNFNNFVYLFNVITDVKNKID